MQLEFLTKTLKPLALIYGLIQKLRVLLYKRGILKSHTLPVKVICVGNITVGGTGKTPTVIHLARLLQQFGYKVTILSRGYKRTSKEETLVVSQGDGPLVNWQQSGDEPYLMAQELSFPVIVGKRRYLSGLLALKKFQPDVILLDDGYQHLNLNRDINLLLINAANPFGNGCLLPAGVLREPLDAIQRADVILLSKANQAQHLNSLMHLVKKYNAKAPVFRATHCPSVLVELESKTDWGLDWLRGKQVATLSGIGDPASFKHLLEKLGARVVKEGCYPDHYSYRANDLRQFGKEALEHSAQAIITTAKDALRFPEEGRETHLPILILKIELKIEDEYSQWESFWRTLNNV